MPLRTADAALDPVSAETAARALQAMVDAVGRLPDPDALIPETLRIVGAAFRSVACAFFEVTPDDRVSGRYWYADGRLHVGAGAPEWAQHESETYALLAAGFTVPPAYLDGQRPRHRTGVVMIDHARGSAVPEFDVFAQRSGWELELNVPVMVEGESPGTLCIYRRASERFTPREIRLAEALARLLGMALATRELVEVASMRRLENALARERESEAERRTVLLRAVAAVAERLTRTADPLAALPDVCRVLGEATRVGRVNVFRHDPVARATTLVADWCASDLVSIGMLSPQPLPDEEFPEVLEPLLRGEVYHSLLAEKHGRNHALNAAGGVRSDLHVPILMNGVLWGIINFDDCRTDRLWSDGEIDVLRSAASAIAGGLQRRAIETERADAVAEARARDSRERADELARANAAMRLSMLELAELRSVESVLEAIVRAAIELLDAAAGGFVLARSDCGMLDVHPLERDDDGVFRRRQVIEVPLETEAERWWERMAAVDFCWWASPESHEMRTEAREWHAARGHRMVAQVPLRRDGRLVASLGLCFTDERRPTDARVDVLRVLASQAALALHMAHLGSEALETARARQREREAQERAELLQTASAITRALLGATDLDASIRDALRDLAAATGTDRACVLLEEHGPDGLIHRVAAEWCADGVPLQASSPASVIRNAELPPALIERLRLGESVFLTITDEDQPFMQLHRALGVVVTGASGLFVDGRYVGVLAFDLCRADARWSAAQVSAIEIAANGISAALQQRRSAARHAAELASQQQAVFEARADELVRANDVLRRGVERLHSLQSLDEVLDAFLAEALRITGASDGVLSRRDGADFVVQTLRTDGRTLPLGANGPCVMRDDPLGILAEVRRGRPTPAVVDDRYAQWLPDAHAYHLYRGHRLLWHFPFRAGGEVQGFLGLAFRETQVPATAIETVIALSHQASAALEILRLGEAERAAAVEAERARAVQQRAAELAEATHLLQSSISRLAESGGPDRFLDHVLATAASVSGATDAAIYLLGDDAEQLQIRRAFAAGRFVDVERDRSLPDLRVADGDFAMEWRRLERGEERMLVGAVADPLRAWGGTRPRDASVEAVLCVPLKAGAVATGCLALGFRSTPMIPPHRAAMLRALADHAALALDFQRLGAAAEEAAVADERNRLAHEIHDTLAQCFTGVIMQLQAASELAAVQPETALACLGRAESLARAGLAEARRSLRQLRADPGAALDLGAAFRDLVLRTTTGTAVQATVEVHGEARALPPGAALQLLRIGQEAFTNALRHAAAREIRLTLEFTEAALRLTVHDDGRGMDLTTASDGGGFGLIGMRQRAARIGAKLQIGRAAGGGTVLETALPLAPAPRVAPTF